LQQETLHNTVLSDASSENPKGLKFLIIRLSSIGDIVLTTPVIRCLKQQVQGAEIHFLVKRQFNDVVKHNPNIDKIHFYRDDKEQMIAGLQAEKFNAIIDLHHNTKTLRIKKALKVKAHSFYKLNIQKYLLTAFKINVLPKVHIVDRYMKTVEMMDRGWTILLPRKKKQL
jgi:ADP-heptose:LPS heptosyltransferase